MKRIIRLIECHSVEEVNQLISNDNFTLYERSSNGTITFIVAETKNLFDFNQEDGQDCGNGQSTPAKSGSSQSDVPFSVVNNPIGYENPSQF